MRLLFLTTELFAHGGIQRYNRMLLEVLQEYVRKNGGSLKLLSLNDAKRVERDSGIKCFERHKIGFVLASLNAMSQTDVVILGHVCFLPLWLLGRLFATKAKAILVLHGVEAWSVLPLPHRLAAYHLFRLVAVSRYTLETFRASNGLQGLDGVVVPNCIDPAFERSLFHNDKDPSTGDGRFLLTVSRLTTAERKGKGIDVIIKAIPHLLELHPDLLWVFVGDGDDRALLSISTKQEGIEKHVSFIGRVSDEDLMTYYSQAQVFVLPSAKEGFGIVYIEAMAHGLPVVAVKAGATPEVVTDGETGFLVPFGDVGALVRAVDELLRNPDLRKRMGALGRQRVRDLYTFQRFRENWWTLLEGFACAS